MSALPATLGIGVLTWRAHQTVAVSVASWQQARLLDHASDAMIFFQQQEADDAARAQAWGFRAIGAPENIGIAPGMEQIARALDTDYILFLENDCPTVLPAPALAEVLDRVLADMTELSIPYFSLRSRRHPGEILPRRRKYLQAFGMRHPLAELPEKQRAHAGRQRLGAWLRYRPWQLRATAVYVEEDPVAVQPKALRWSPRGNILTHSGFHAWSNQSVIVRRDWFLSVMMGAYATAPVADTNTPRRCLEPVANRPWWYRARIPLGFAEPGAFTHRRLDGWSTR